MDQLVDTFVAQHAPKAAKGKPKTPAKKPNLYLDKSVFGDVNFIAKHLEVGRAISETAKAKYAQKNQKHSSSKNACAVADAVDAILDKTSAAGKPNYKNLTKAQQAEFHRRHTIAMNKKKLELDEHHQQLVLYQMRRVILEDPDKWAPLLHSTVATRVRQRYLREEKKSTKKSHAKK